MKISKKIVFALLIGTAAVSSAACGNNESKTTATDSEKMEIQKNISPTKIPYRSMFKNSVFLGDSIIGGLTNDDLLDGANVMGALGATVKFTLEHVDELVSRKPAYVFLSLGQNDIKAPVETSKKKFIVQYSKLIKGIRAKLPEAKIYILSITPVSPDVSSDILSNKHIDDFNLALKNLAKNEKIHYIDLSPIFKNNDIRYDEDGSHFKNAYYPLLLDYLGKKTNMANQPGDSSRVADSSHPFKEAFKNSVFLGDSILGSLSYLNKLEKANVMAPSGATLDLLLLNMDELASRKPEHIFILIGSNDIKISSDKKEFIAKYAQLIGGIKEKLPNAKINVLSITPVSADALYKEPRYERIPEYNLSLQELARSENVNYIDLMPIFKNNAIPYTSDGIRFKPDFYPLFLDHVKKTSIDVLSQKT